MNDDLRWKQYELLATHTRQILDLLVKANTFYYAVTGAMLSFYLSRPSPISPVRFALIVPLLMAILCTVLFVKASATIQIAEDEIERIARGFTFTSWPSAHVLRYALIVSAIGTALAGAGLLTLIVWPGLVAVTDTSAM